MYISNPAQIGAISLPHESADIRRPDRALAAEPIGMVSGNQAHGRMEDIPVERQGLAVDAV
jgi:hypothetical protein